jgi:hypothetical protein
MKKFIMPAILLLSFVCFISAIPAALSPVKDKSEVFVLATLYSRHKTTPVYDLAALKKIVQAINPDVFVLDVTPAELKTRQVWPSKIEYPGAVFPLVDSSRHFAYAAEPPEPMFTEIVSSVKEVHKKFRASRPDAARALDDMTSNLFEALKASWQTPADVNGSITDKALEGKRVLEDKLRGPEDVENGRRWTQHIIDVTLQAAKEHPGKRILVLNGIENCYVVREGLRRHAGVTVVDIEQWLRQHP